MTWDSDSECCVLMQNPTENPTIFYALGERRTRSATKREKESKRRKCVIWLLILCCVVWRLFFCYSLFLFSSKFALLVCMRMLWIIDRMTTTIRLSIRIQIHKFFCEENMENLQRRHHYSHLIRSVCDCVSQFFLLLLCLHQFVFCLLYNLFQLSHIVNVFLLHDSHVVSCLNHIIRFVEHLWNWCVLDILMLSVPRHILVINRHSS